jgi:hypothetical protein
MYANVHCSRFRATQMSQRYARVPFLHMYAHACSNPGRLCQRYAPVSPSMYISHMAAALQKALACCGLGLAAV